jgi:hypothetical protein
MCKGYRGLRWLAYGLLPVLGLASPVLGDTNYTTGKSGTAPAQSKTAGTEKKDPLAVVFALPKGVVLNAKQTAAYKKLKADNEGAYRTALLGIQSQSKETSNKSLKQAADLRTKIHAGIRDILAMSVVDAQNAAAQAAAQQFRAEHTAQRRLGSSAPCPCGR